MDRRDKFPASPEVDAFRQTILKTAEEMVVTKFPQRIVQLNKMLSSGRLTSSPSSVYQKINIPVPDVSSKDLGSSTADQRAATSATGTSQTGQTDSSNGERVSPIAITILDLAYKLMATTSNPMKF